MQVWHTISTLTALHCLWFHTYVIRVCSNSALEHTILPESLWSSLFPLVKWINCNSFEIPFPCNTHSSSQPFTGIHLLHAAFALRLKTIPHHELAESSRNDFLPCQHLIVLYFQQIILSCDGPKQTFFEEGIPKEVYAGDQVSLLLPLSWPSSDLWSIRQLRAEAPLAGNQSHWRNKWRMREQDGMRNMVHQEYIIDRRRKLWW